MRPSIHKANEFDVDLAIWAFFHWNEKIREMIENKDDDYFQLRSLGEIARRRASEDHPWFFKSARIHRREMLELSGYIGEVVCYGHVFPTPGYGWRRWLDEIALI